MEVELYSTWQIIRNLHIETEICSTEKYHGTKHIIREPYTVIHKAQSKYR